MQLLLKQLCEIPPCLSSHHSPTHHHFFQTYLVLLIPEPFEDSAE